MLFTSAILNHSLVLIVTGLVVVSFEMFCTSCGFACIEDGNFCHEYGNPLDSNIRAENNTDNIIEGYFYRVVIPIVI